MAKVCAICGKTTVFGNKRKHRYGGGWERRAPRMNRAWKPNIRSVDLEIDGKRQKVDVCMKCYKKIRKTPDIPACAEASAGRQNAKTPSKLKEQKNKS